MNINTIKIDTDDIFYNYLPNEFKCGAVSYKHLTIYYWYYPYLSGSKNVCEYSVIYKQTYITTTLSNDKKNKIEHVIKNSLCTIK